MGEYAEIAWKQSLARGTPDRSNYKGGRNPIAAHCPHCGKGIRAIAGRIEPSMKAHIKVKHPKETPNE